MNGAWYSYFMESIEPQRESGTDEQRIRFMHAYLIWKKAENVYGDRHEEWEEYCRARDAYLGTTPWFMGFESVPE